MGGDAFGGSGNLPYFPWVGSSNGNDDEPEELS